MAFFREIYESWKPIQKRKYEAVSVLMGEINAKGPCLDIGCGPFNFDLPLQTIRTDINNGDVLADGSFLPFRNQSFTTVLTVDSAHLFSINEACRVLEKGGFLIIGLPKNMWSRIQEPLCRKIREISVPGQEEEIIKVFQK